MQDPEAMTTGRSLRAALWVFLSLAGVSASITLLFLGMRAVMEIGGVCAEGGPYVPRQPCPEGVPLVMVGGIWGGIILAFVYVAVSIRYGIPSLALLLWPALFLSLGWNFLEYGLDPPGEDGLAWGWLVCAAVFFAMGGGPLVVWLRGIARGSRGLQIGGSARQLLVPPIVRHAAVRLRPTRTTTAGAPVPGTAEGMTAEGDGRVAEPAPVTEPGDLVSALERLAWLRRTGAIDEEEYEAAKERLLGPEEAR